MAQKQQVAVGAVLSEVLRTYRANAGPLLSLAAIIFLPLTLITEIVSRESVNAGMAVSLALSGSAAFLYCAIAAPVVLPSKREIADVSIARLWSEASPGFAALLLAGAIYTLATTLGVLLFIVPGLFLITIWAVAPAVIRFEGAAAAAALSRSRALVKGHGWRVLALMMSVVLIVLAGTILIQGLAIGIAGEETGTFVGSWLGVVVAAPLFGLTPTVLYRTLVQGEEADPGPGDEALDTPATGSRDDGG